MKNKELKKKPLPLRGDSEQKKEEYILESDNVKDDERLLQDDTIHPEGTVGDTIEMVKVEPPKGAHPNKPWLDKYTFQKGKQHPVNRIAARVSLPDLLERIGRERVPPTIRRMIRAKNQACPNWMTNYEAMARTLWVHACNGQPFAVAFIAERTEGKVAQQMKIEAVSNNKDPRDLTDEQLMTMCLTGTATPSDNETQLTETFEE